MKKLKWRVFRNVMLGIVFINKILELPVFHKKNEREKLCITQILSRAVLGSRAIFGQLRVLAPPSAGVKMAFMIMFLQICCTP